MSDYRRRNETNRKVVSPPGEPISIKPKTRMASSRPRPTQRPRNSSNGAFAVAATAGLIWKFLVAAVMVLGIGLYLWGGTTATKEKCVAHRLGTGSSGFVGTLACAAAHK